MAKLILKEKDVSCKEEREYHGGIRESQLCCEVANKEAGEKWRKDIGNLKKNKMMFHRQLKNSKRRGSEGKERISCSVYKRI